MRRGLRRFCVGLAKKVLLADALGRFWGQMNADFTQAGALGAWLGLIAFSFQIYFDFSGYTDSTESRAELDWDMISPVKAMLDPEDGFAAKFDLQLMRDNFDIYFVGNAGFDRGVWIEYGKNMTSVRRSVDSTSVVTRVIPIGQDKDGNDMTLPGDTPWIDSDNIDDFPEPHIYVLRCSSACKVGSTKEGGGKVTRLARYGRVRADIFP